MDIEILGLSVSDQLRDFVLQYHAYGIYEIESTGKKFAVDFGPLDNNNAYGNDAYYLPNWAAAIKKATGAHGSRFLAMRIMNATGCAPDVTDAMDIASRKYVADLGPEDLGLTEMTRGLIENIICNYEGAQ